MILCAYKKIPISCFSCRITLAEGWAVESIQPSRYEVRPDPKDISFSDGGPKAWFVTVKRAGVNLTRKG